MSAPRRPINFWGAFNAWWRSELERTGNRPTAVEINVWHDTEAESTWPERIRPNAKATRVHAKCLRSVDSVRAYFRTYRAVRKGARTRAGEDDEDEEENDGTTSEDESNGTRPISSSGAARSAPPTRKARKLSHTGTNFSAVSQQDFVTHAEQSSGSQMQVQSHQSAGRATQPPPYHAQRDTQHPQPSDLLQHSKPIQLQHSQSQPLFFPGMALRDLMNKQQQLLSRAASVAAVVPKQEPPRPPMHVAPFHRVATQLCTAGVMVQPFQQLAAAPARQHLSLGPQSQAAPQPRHRSSATANLAHNLLSPPTSADASCCDSVGLLRTWYPPLFGAQTAGTDSYRQGSCDMDISVGHSAAAMAPATADTGSRWDMLNGSLHAAGLHKHEQTGQQPIQRQAGQQQMQRPSVQQQMPRASLGFETPSMGLEAYAAARAMPGLTGLTGLPAVKAIKTEPVSAPRRQLGSTLLTLPGDSARHLRWPPSHLTLTAPDGSPLPSHSPINMCLPWAVMGEAGDEQEPLLEAELIRGLLSDLAQGGTPAGRISPDSLALLLVSTPTADQPCPPADLELMPSMPPGTNARFPASQGCTSPMGGQTAGYGQSHSRILRELVDASATIHLKPPGSVSKPPAMTPWPGQACSLTEADIQHAAVERALQLPGGWGPAPVRQSHPQRPQAPMSYMALKGSVRGGSDCAFQPRQTNSWGAAGPQRTSHVPPSCPWSPPAPPPAQRSLDWELSGLMDPSLASSGRLGVHSHDLGNMMPGPATGNPLGLPHVPIHPLQSSRKATVSQSSLFALQGRARAVPPQRLPHLAPPPQALIADYPTHQLTDIQYHGKAKTMLALGLNQQPHHPHLSQPLICQPSGAFTDWRMLQQTDPLESAAKASSSSLLTNYVGMCDFNVQSADRDQGELPGQQGSGVYQDLGGLTSPPGFNSLSATPRHTKAPQVQTQHPLDLFSKGVFSTAASQGSLDYAQFLAHVT